MRSRAVAALVAVTGLLLKLGLAWLLLAPSQAAGAAGAASGGDAAAACAALAGFAAPATADPAVRFAGVRGERIGDRPVCALDGRVAGASGFRLLLPVADWNGRFVLAYCDGRCPVPPETICDEIVGRGHACLVPKATGGAPWPDAATHAMTVAAKAAIAHLHGRPPARSLFLGCSAGGHAALRTAQRHPRDFDGIVAGAPPIEPEAFARALRWNLEATRARGRDALDAEGLRRLHRAVLERCDAGDGLADGLVGDPLRCRVEPRALACGTAPADRCLAPAAVDAAVRLYAGPAAAQGGAAGTAGLLPGSELEWAAYLDARRDLARWAAASRGDAAAGADGVPDLAPFAAAGGKLILYHGLADPFVSPRRTIRAFEDLAHRMGGLVAAQATVRLFAVPAMAHCGGGPGASRIDFLAALDTWTGQGSVRPPDDVIAFRTASATRRVQPFAPQAHDAAQALYAGWMLGGPVSLAQARAQWATALSRPVFAYPLPTRYKGRGDPAHWMSFYAPSDFTLQFAAPARE